jgi:hypothetical protein
MGDGYKQQTRSLWVLDSEVTTRLEESEIINLGEDNWGERERMLEKITKCKCEMLRIPHCLDSRLTVKSVRVRVTL